MQENTQAIQFKKSKAKNFFLARDYSNAEKLLKEILSENQELSDSNFLEVNKLLGTLYIRNKNFNESLNVWQQIEERFPNNSDALNNLGVVYRSLGQYDKSIAVLEHAQEVDGETETVLFNLGSTYKDAKNFPQAIECFQKLVKLKPDDALAYNYLGTAYLSSGDEDNAAYYYKKGLQVDPNHPYLNYNLANIYKNQKAFTEALCFYNTALKANPNWSDVLQKIVDIYIEQGNITEAINFQKAIIKISGESEKTLTALAGLYFKLDDETTAEQYYKKAIKFSGNPTAEVITDYASYLISKKRIAEAKTLLERHKDYDSFELLLLYADVCLTVNDFASAKEIIQKLYKKNPKSLDVLKMYGKLFSSVGQREQAENIFKQILTHYPSEIGLRLDLAKQYFETGNYVQCENELSKYLIERPGDIDARILLGNCYKQLGKYDKAKFEYESVLKTDPKNIVAMAALSSFLQEHGNVLDAIMMADKMINVQSERGSLADIKSLTDSLALYEKATEKYNRQKKVHPKFLQSGTSSPEPESPAIQAETDSGMDLTDDDIDKQDMSLPFDDLVEMSDEEESWETDEPIDEQTLSDMVDVDTPVDIQANDDSFLDADGRDAAFTSSANSQNRIGDAKLPPQKYDDDSYVLPEVSEEPQFANPIAAMDDTTESPSNMSLPPELSAFAQMDRAEYPNKDNEINSQDLLQQQSDMLKGLTDQMKNFDELLSMGKEQREDTELAKQNDLLDNLNKKLDNLKLPEYSENMEKDKEAVADTDTRAEQLQKQNELLDGLNKKLEELKKQDEIKSNEALKQQAEKLEDIQEKLDDFDDLLSLGTDGIDNLENINDAIENRNDEVENENDEDHQTLEDAITNEGIDLSEIQEQPVQKKVPVGKMKQPPQFEHALKEISSMEMLELFKALRDLMMTLPETESKLFLASSERVQLQYIIDKLSGSVGLRMRAIFMKMRDFLNYNQYYESTENVTIQSLLDYLKQMAISLPDKDFAEVCVSKLDSIIEKIR